MKGLLVTLASIIFLSGAVIAGAVEEGCVSKDSFTALYYMLTGLFLLGVVIIL